MIFKTNFFPETTVDGVILIITCQKYFYNRILGNTFRINSHQFNGWPIVYVLGDKDLKQNYAIAPPDMTNSFNSYILTVKSEDYYAQIFKKIVMAQEAVYKIFNIKYGILKCDDDITFNKPKLKNFLNNLPSCDWMSRRYANMNDLSGNFVYKCSDNIIDYTIMTYYSRHPDEYLNICKENPEFKPENYIISPVIPKELGGAGGVYYLSNKASNIIVEYFKKCNYDIYYFDKDSQSYPFVCREDVGTAFIMANHGIPMVSNPNMFCHAWKELNKESIGFHTHILGHDNGIHSDILDILIANDKPLSKSQKKNRKRREKEKNNKLNNS